MVVPETIVKIPNSVGLNSCERIGDARKVRAWPVAVPPRMARKPRRVADASRRAVRRRGI